MMEPEALIDEPRVKERVTETLLLVATLSEADTAKKIITERETAGNCSPICVCSGSPDPSNVDMLTMEAAVLVSSVENPDI